MGVPLHNRASSATPSLRAVNAPTVAAPAPTDAPTDETTDLSRAVWSTAEQNNLPDASFAYIAPGGKRDADGRTMPRNLRYLPYKDADGKVDAAHVRNALARLSQANIPDSAKASARKKLVAAAKSVGVDVADESARAVAADGLTRAAAASDASPDPTADTHATFYAPIMRRDDAKWEVEGVLTDEGIDTYGTIFDYDSAKRAVERWQGNVREMHQLKAVGRRVDFDCDDALRQVKLRVRVSRGAPDTWEKVGDGTLAGFSINAVNAKRELRTVGNRTVPCYTDYDYAEVSLVDVPSNPGAAGSGLVICRAAAFSADGEGYVSDVIETDEPAVVEAPVEAPAEPVVAPTVPETPIVAPVEEPPALVAPVVAPPSSVPSFDELVEQFGIPADQRAMLARAVAQIAPQVGATTPVTPPPAVVAPVAPVAPSVVPQAADSPVPTQQRASVDTSSGAGFLGSDLDDGSDAGKPIGKAMLRDSGLAHSEHTHAHADDYAPMHTHTHDHTHQDGTSHSHPHMHNHAHHDHSGDPEHSHPHTHAHEHSHTYRSAAADLSISREEQPVTTPVVSPVTALVGDPAQQAAQAVVVVAETPSAPESDLGNPLARAASHDPFTGSHTHAHPAMGSQGGDDSHKHEHSHDGDANHDHAHADASDAEASDAPDDDAPDAPDDSETESERAVMGDTPAIAGTPARPSQPTQQRAGQRISADTRTGLHEAALGILRTCGCPVCQDAISLYDPDNDGDDDLDGGDADTDGDADEVMSDANDDGADGADGADGERVAKVFALTRAAARQAYQRQAERNQRELTRATRMQQITLRRAARSVVAEEVQREMAPISGAISQLRAIAARLTAVQGSPTNTPASSSATGSSTDSPTNESLTRMATQQDEMRAVLTAVQGLVEQIAAQDARVGPILRAADKTLGLAPGAVLDPSAPRPSVGSLSSETMAAAIKQLQAQGLMRSQTDQVNAAALLIEQQMRQGQYGQ